MSILLYDYKELTECISEVERIEARVSSSSSSNKKKEWLTKGGGGEVSATTALDSFLSSKWVGVYMMVALLVILTLVMMSADGMLLCAHGVTWSQIEKIKRKRE